MTRTKAEQTLLEDFERASPALPGPGWLAELRRRAIGALAATGLPSRRVEQFKYTDLRERLREVPPVHAGAAQAVDAAALERALGPLAGLDADRLVVVDGRFAAGLSTARFDKDRIEVRALADVLAKAPAWLEGKFQGALAEGAAEAIGQINLAFMSDGVMLKVKAGVAAPRPILLVFARGSGTPALTACRNIVAVEAGARATLIEAHVALGGAAPGQHGCYATDVDVAAGAHLTHIRSVPGAVDAAHLSRWRVVLGEEAVYRGFQLTAGAPLARNEILVGFNGADAKLDLSGAFLGRGSDHADTTLVVEHTTTGCESRELFKGVLDGRARGVFQGKIIVRADAQKTDGKQMAQALMLSEEAEFDSKPELEIYADDVACGHGTTAAEIDPGMLFYLRSRGIPKSEARRLLIESFVGEALEKVEAEPVREALREIALAWLDETAAAAAARAGA